MGAAFRGWPSAYDESITKYNSSNMVKEKKSVLILALLSTLTLGGAVIGVITPLHSKSYDPSIAEQKMPVRLERVGNIPCGQ